MSASLYDVVGLALILLALFMQWQVYVSRIIFTLAASSAIVAFSFAWQGVSSDRRLLIAVAVITILVRTMLIPALITRNLHAAPWRAREDRPVIGVASSILLALALVILSLWLYTWAIDGATAGGRYGALPLALLFQGVFLVISRRNAFIQLAGYLVAENAVLLLAAWTFPELPLVIEGAALLDLLGIVIVSRIIVRVRETSADEALGGSAPSHEQLRG